MVETRMANETGRGTIIPRLFRTTAFRVTIVYMLLFITAVGLLGGFVYQATIIEQRKKVEDELRSEVQFFLEVYDQGGLFGLARTMDVRINASHTVLYYLIVPPYGDKVAGNLTTLPPEALQSDNLFEFTYEYLDYSETSPLGEPKVSVKPAMALVAHFPSANGQALGPFVLVGRDVSDIVSIRNSARAAFFRVGLATLVLGLFVGVASSRAFLQRLDDINRTSSAIRSGDLTRRISLHGVGDEFDNLAMNLNMMLDQIERLMVGMRQVSDNVAHDLRSPLTRIRSRLEDALRSDASGQREALEETADDVDRLLATFNALLAMTRIESGERRKGFTQLDLQSLSQEIGELYEPAAEDAGFSLVVEAAQVPPVYASRELISQALSNLLDNAFKYARSSDASGEQPRIEIRVSPKVGGGAMLEVLDNGPGVAENDRERILNRFVRLESSRTTTGSGLGLSMVAAIASAHQAQLTIGDGLPHQHQKDDDNGQQYGLSIRIAFPPPIDFKGRDASSSDAAPASATAPAPASAQLNDQA